MNPKACRRQSGFGTSAISPVPIFHPAPLLKLWRKQQETGYLPSDFVPALGGIRLINFNSLRF